jgi:hypothetical protein
MTMGPHVDRSRVHNKQPCMIGTVTCWGRGESRLGFQADPLCLLLPSTRSFAIRLGTFDCVLKDSKFVNIFSK